MRVESCAAKSISIHALREEGDLKQHWVEGKHYWISIHALREEGDQSRRRRDCFCTDFYPRPPRGGRPAPHPVVTFVNLFLSTPSARRATPL